MPDFYAGASFRTNARKILAKTGCQPIPMNLYRNIAQLELNPISPNPCVMYINIINTSPGSIQSTPFFPVFRSLAGYFSTLSDVVLTNAMINPISIDRQKEKMKNQVKTTTICVFAGKLKMAEKYSLASNWVCELSRPLFCIVWVSLFEI